jgi:hypothetical protein
MSQTKMSPDEKITAIALDQPDPFARPGQSSKGIAKSPARPQRDFSHLDEPLPRQKKKEEEVVAKAEEPAKKRGRKAKTLESVEAPEPKLEEIPKIDEIIVESRNQDGMPSYRTDFSGRDIMVGCAWYKTTNPVTCFALIALALDFGRDKIRFDMELGDALIYHSRNRLAHKFLQTEAKYLLMIDDDIIPSIGRPPWMRATVQAAQNVNDLPLQRHIVHRLLNSGKTLIGGAYFGRQEGGKLMCSDQSLAKNARQYDDFIVPVDWIGTGCLMIHRKVFTDMQEKFPELATNDPLAPFDYFLPMKGHVGEDVAFCHRAKQAGHQTHIDLGTPIYHVGYKTY